MVAPQRSGSRHQNLHLFTLSNILHPTTLTDTRPASPPVYTVVMAPPPCISGGGSGRFSSIPLVLLSSSAGYQHVPLGVLLQLLGWSVTVIMDEGEETARENNYIRHRLRGDGAGPRCDVSVHDNDQEGGLREIITCRRTDQSIV